MNLSPTLYIPVLFVILTAVFARIGLKPYEVSTMHRKRHHPDAIVAPILTLLMLAALYGACIWGLRQQHEAYAPVVTVCFVWIAPFVAVGSFIRRAILIHRAPKRSIPREFGSPSGTRHDDRIVNIDFRNPPTGGPRTQSNPKRRWRRAA